jgi:undecaprenyl pyrophosphate synthase
VDTSDTAKIVEIIQARLKKPLYRTYEMRPRQGLAAPSKSELPRHIAVLCDPNVNVAVGYGGRQEIADAVCALLTKELANGASARQLAEAVTVDAISENLYTSGQPDPDLVIRTSGEQRLSGFLL